MVIIKRGKGFLVLVALVLAALIMNGVTNALYDNEYYGSHLWPKVGTLWLTGILCTATGLFLQRRPTKVKDKDWVRGESADHLFFIPVVYWGPIFALISIAYLIYSLR